MNDDKAALEALVKRLKDAGFDAAQIRQTAFSKLRVEKPTSEPMDLEAGSVVFKERKPGDDFVTFSRQMIADIYLTEEQVLRLLERPEVIERLAKRVAHYLTMNMWSVK